MLEVRTLCPSVKRQAHGAGQGLLVALGGEEGGPHRQGEDVGSSEGVLGLAPCLHPPQVAGAQSGCASWTCAWAGLSWVADDRPCGDFSVTGQPTTTRGRGRGGWRLSLLAVPHSLLLSWRKRVRGVFTLS